ncbi:hypothetical protein [Gordonia phthalatica]|uniref:Uncharacterized protein n=1 Tax=Gordonia phthalatica TaxID=1136941 RepID=A0A0N9N2R5_9ACTN|nr:hypothetical protein [Gordonia phthalatica]ALG84554.1 hypothetical protein ACH46_08670 [Gordonia phthalatica]
MSAETEPDTRDAGGDFRLELGATAGIAVAFLVLRMLAVAHWDWNVVAAISDTFDFSDAFPIAFGTVVGQPLLTGILVAVLLPLVLMRIVWPAPQHRGTLQVTTILSLIVLIVITVTLSTTFGNVWTLVGAAGFCVIVVSLRMVLHRGVLHDAILAVTRKTALIAAAGLLALAAFNDAPWMSAEQITTDNGVIDGYILEAEPGFLHVLTEERDVIIVPDSEVQDRRLAD